MIVLCRTQQLLEARDSHYDELLGRIERSRGVSGLRHVQATLEKASEQAAKVDDDKAAAVNDIARMVAAITEEIKARKQVRRLFRPLSLEHSAHHYPALPPPSRNSHRSSRSSATSAGSTAWSSRSMR